MKTGIFAPAHLSATGIGHVSGLVFWYHANKKNDAPPYLISSPIGQQWHAPFYNYTHIDLPTLPTLSTQDYPKVPKSTLKYPKVPLNTLKYR